MDSRYFNTQRKGDHQYCWKKILQQFGGTKGGVLMFDTIAKWWSPEILQLCDAKNPLHLEVFWNHIDSDPGFWNPRKTHITNDDGWKIHHEWRCISYWNMGDFSNVMLVFQGCINFHAHFFAVVGRHFSISKPGAMSYGSISMEVRPFFFEGRCVGFPVWFFATSKKDP